MLVVGSWVARHGRGRGAFRWVGARRGIRWVPLHSNPPLEADGDLPPCPRWDCCRFHACGRGMVEDCTAAGRMSSCIKYIVFICAFCAKSPLVRMRSPVQIWVAAPKILENLGFRGFFVAKSCFMVCLQISDPHRDPHAEMRQRNQWTQEHRTGSLPSCPAYFSFCF